MNRNLNYLLIITIIIVSYVICSYEINIVYPLLLTLLIYSEKHIKALTRKELSVYLLSPSTYMIAALFIILIGLQFLF